MSNELPHEHETEMIPVSVNSRGYTDEFVCKACRRIVFMHQFSKVCEYEFCPWCGQKVKE